MNNVCLISPRDTFADLVSTASYVVSASQVPDPSEAGMFDAPTRPRVRNYRILDGAYTYAIVIEGLHLCSLFLFQRIRVR